MYTLTMFKGIRQKTLLVLESYCIIKLNINHIWLDVYQNNLKAIYVYEKLGYIKFQENIQNLKTVLFYEKNLTTGFRR